MIEPRDEQHYAELSILGYLMAEADNPGLVSEVFAACPPIMFAHNDTRAIAEPVDEGTVKAEARPLTKSQTYALESFHEALKREGGNSINVEAWRPYFYAGHFAETDDAKKKAFQRARKELLEIEKISVFNDSYRWTSGTTQGQCPELSRTQSPQSTGTSGTHTL